MLWRAAAIGLTFALAGCTKTIVLQDMWDAGTSDRGDARDAGGGMDGHMWNDFDGQCGSHYVNLNYYPQAASLLVLLDRSSAMQAAFETTTRQAATETALLSAIKNYQGKVKFGFEQFPADPTDRAAANCPHQTCCAGSVGIEPDYNALNSIKGPIQCSDPVSSPCPSPTADSPSYAALANVRDYYKSKLGLSGGGRYVLLVTASEPSCAADVGTDECARALSAASDLGGMGVQLLVLSVGYQPVSGSCLVKLSQTGSSQPLPSGFNTLYVPNTIQDLSNEASAIALGVARSGCTIDEPAPPPEQAQVVVSIGQNQIPQADTNGWSFSNFTRTSITLSGSACDQYLSSPPDVRLFVEYQTCSCGGGACSQQP
jgi:hypothetical protein